MKNAHQEPCYVWQKPGWPQWEIDAAALLEPLSVARELRGIALGKAEAIGFGGVGLAQVVNEIWIQEAMSGGAGSLLPTPGVPAFTPVC